MLVSSPLLLVNLCDSLPDLISHAQPLVVRLVRIRGYA